MNTFLNHVVGTIAAELEGVRGIVLRGSRRSDALVDMWSDTDLLIVLDKGTPVEEQGITRACNAIGFVVGSEKHWYGEHSLLYRTSIAWENSIQLLDAMFCSYDEWDLIESHKDRFSTVIYGDLKLGEGVPISLAANYSFESYEYNHTWFKYCMAIKKFARNDHFIGLHLLLDLVRDYLVVEMIERDIRYGTDIHRYGYGEQLPQKLELSQLNLTCISEVYDYIDKLAYEYDQKLLSNVNGYVSRYSQVAKYVEDTRGRHLK